MQSLPFDASHLQGAHMPIGCYVGCAVQRSVIMACIPLYGFSEKARIACALVIRVKAYVAYPV
jgi:hypothetical protein